MDTIIDRLPSLRTLRNIALSTLGFTQQILESSDNRPIIPAPHHLEPYATCSNPQLSCHVNPIPDNLCCFNHPGGALLQTQFWDTHPVTGPQDSWTIHGLWPDNCDGTYEANCDDERAYRNISAILKSSGANGLLDFMQEYWVSDSGSSEHFWEHEWSKHGTCISTLRPECYGDYQPTEEVPIFFNRTAGLFKSLPTYEWLSDAGIVPSSRTTYSTAQIQAALAAKHGGRDVYLGCRSGQLNEVWYFFNVAGSLQTGSFEPSEVVGVSSKCPATGIKYLPKGSGVQPTRTATEPVPLPTSTGPAFSGKGYLNVFTGGNQKGCLIGAGKWYTTGSCASFTTSPVSSEHSEAKHVKRGGGAFTLKSRKGDCGIVKGALTCGNSVRHPSTFSSDGKMLMFERNRTFYADAVPRGWKQGTVYTEAGDHSTNLSIEWRNL
ncbi:Ribonuclease T2 precursor (RNase T2) [Recurvomyces mirabilis]|uniref:Ribonuclease T2-like n=1 Tax=Recurvomyces mirabilis TaxID=574656 RepID=A0AAE0WIW8_9PEZI|nr:Ribonuclease T2 precursor (RNase T2) [Recurvomyces mirabilis]KAK5159193.1 Ribonuclease T2 precursor (RNase T2) [Recurvomyces mirabilis]